MSLFLFNRISLILAGQMQKYVSSKEKSITAQRPEGAVRH